MDDHRRLRPLEAEALVEALDALEDLVAEHLRRLSERAVTDMGLVIEEGSGVYLPTSLESGDHPGGLRARGSGFEVEGGIGLRFDAGIRSAVREVAGYDSGLPGKLRLALEDQATASVVDCADRLDNATENPIVSHFAKSIAVEAAQGPVISPASTFLASVIVKRPGLAGFVRGLSAGGRAELDPQIERALRYADEPWRSQQRMLDASFESALRSVLPRVDFPGGALGPEYLN